MYNKEEQLKQELRDTLSELEDTIVELSGLGYNIHVSLDKRSGDSNHWIEHEIWYYKQGN